MTDQATGPMQVQAPQGDFYVHAFNRLRTDVKRVAAALKEVQKDYGNRRVHNQTSIEDSAEVHDNLVLAYRHLEDASMRLGKAIQARDGGVSVYDKATTVGA